MIFYGGGIEVRYNTLWTKPPTLYCCEEIFSAKLIIYDSSIKKYKILKKNVIKSTKIVIKDWRYTSIEPGQIEKANQINLDQLLYKTW